MKHKLLCLLCTLIFFVSAFPAPVFANNNEIPHEFWALNDKYNAALEAQDHNGTAYYGSQIVALIQTMSDCDQKTDIIGSRSYNTAFAYYFLNDYENAVKYFQIYLPYGIDKNWTNGVIIAENFVKQLTGKLELYQQTDEEQIYFGAKNEPHGVLYGQTSETAQPNDSMILLYLEYGHEDYFNWANVIMKRAREEGKAVEVALNYPNQGDDARYISSNDAYLSTLHSFLNAYPDVDVYLRIGSEVNIWGNRCTPKDFISSFRTIATKMQNLNNVATVFSVAHTSTWKSEAWPYTMHDFYPGDDYVDWVGVTAYANKYFDGKRQNGIDIFNTVCYKTGFSADPVLMVEDVVNTYGNRKPIMISECGSAYQTNGAINEFHHEWGAEYLKKIYALIPMVYPQVKLIAYFNKNMPHEYNYYDLTGSPLLEGTYQNYVKNPWFIQENGTAETYFKKAENTIDASKNITLSAYPRIYGSDTINVTYYLVNQPVGASNFPPYSINISAQSGTHTLKVVAQGDRGGSMEKHYTLTGNNNTNNSFSDTTNLSPNKPQLITA